MADITIYIVNGVYKPTYNWGAPPGKVVHFVKAEVNTEHLSINETIGFVNHYRVPYRDPQAKTYDDQLVTDTPLLTQAIEQRFGQKLPALITQATQWGFPSTVGVECTGALDKEENAAHQGVLSEWPFHANFKTVHRSSHQDRWASTRFFWYSYHGALNPSPSPFGMEFPPCFPYVGKNYLLLSIPFLESGSKLT